MRHRLTAAVLVSQAAVWLASTVVSQEAPASSASAADTTAGAAPLAPATRPRFVDEVLLIEREADRRGRDALGRRLARIQMTLIAEEMSAQDLATRLSIACGDTANFVVVASAETVDELPTITCTLQSRPVPTILHAVQRTTDLRFVYRAGLVQIQSKGEVRELRVLRTFDLTAAVAPLRDRAGPRLGLRAPGEEPPEPPEVDDEKTLSGFTMDRITTLLETHVAPDSWDDDGNTIRAWRGVLFVRQTERNQAKVRALLEELGVVPRRRRLPREFGARGGAPNATVQRWLQAPTNSSSATKTAPSRRRR